MENRDLPASWAVTLRHLAAARFHLQEHVPTGEARAIESELAHYLHHNEFGLALGEAEALGQLCEAPSAYWLELQLAAANMGLHEEANEYARRAEG